MKSIKRKVMVALIAVVVGVGASVSMAAPAMAFSQLEMSQACRLANGNQAGWEAQLTYPDQGVYGWRCFYNNAPWAYWYNTKYGLNVQILCDQIYGGTARFTNQSDAYSWYCG